MSPQKGHNENYFNYTVMSNNKNQQEPYKIGKQIDVTNKEGFYKDGKGFKEGNILKRPLSDGMNQIREIVGSIAIDRLDCEGFIKFYNSDEVHDFVSANLQKLFHPADGEQETVIGFLFSSFFLRRGPEPDSKITYIGKAFPGIRYENRTIKNGPGWERRDLYKKFLGFYLREIFSLLELSIDSKIYEKEFQGIADRLNAHKYNIGEDMRRDLSGDEEYKSDVKRVIQLLKDKKVTSPSGTIEIQDMQLEVYIENPITYNDLYKFGFRYNVPSPDQEFIEMSKDWGVGDLLKASYDRSKTPDEWPGCLKTGIEFSVNLTPLEWREIVEISIKKIPMKYYVWQNYNFPNSAFKAEIPLDAYNFWRVLRGPEERSPFGDDFDREIKEIINQP